MEFYGHRHSSTSQLGDVTLSYYRDTLSFSSVGKSDIHTSPSRASKCSIAEEMHGALPPRRFRVFDSASWMYAVFLPCFRVFALL